MVRVSPWKVLRTPRGPLRGFRVPPPVLTIVAPTPKISSPSTPTLDVEVSTVKLGAVEMAGAAKTTGP